MLLVNFCLISAILAIIKNYRNTMLSRIEEIQMQSTRGIIGIMILVVLKRKILSAPDYSMEFTLKSIHKAFHKFINLLISKGLLFVLQDETH